MSETVGERVHRLRVERGLSLRKLADRVGDVGIGFSHLSRIECGERAASSKALRLLAPALGVTAHYLEFGFDLECPHCGETVDYDTSGKPLAQVG